MQKLSNQKDKFNLDQTVVYLNGAFMSPQLKSVSEVGLEALKVKENPAVVGVDDFFDTPRQLRAEFSKMINNPEPERIALVPSVSYGMANIVRNLQVSGQKLIVAGEQFPSNVYPWMRLAHDQGGKLEIVDPPEETEKRGVKWNEKILAAIDTTTALVALSHVHWADGTLFDLMAIRKRTREVGALLVIDGTQSVGALPFDIQEIEPDALVCAGYKWLLGPYGLGFAYYSEAFENGIPVEENWINRLHSENFAGLVEYEEEYQPGAQRFGMGEQSQFMLAPMLLNALKQINEWQPARIQAYCKDLVEEPLQELVRHGYWVEEEASRASHLFGLRHPELSISRAKQKLSEKGVFVSYRGTSIRVSPYVHNTVDDMQQLVYALIE